MITLPKLTVHSSDDALHLSHSEHTSQERIAGIIPTDFVAKHSHSMVNAHRQLCRNGVVGTFCLLLLEDTGKLNDVSASAKMAGLREVAVGEDMA